MAVMLKFLPIRAPVKQERCQRQLGFPQQGHLVTVPAVNGKEMGCDTVRLCSGQTCALLVLW